MKTDEILNEREKTHGDFERFADLKTALVDACDAYGDYSQLNNTQAVAFSMILTKIARIMCGDPNHADHWDDIAGYAMLGKGKEPGKAVEQQKQWFKSEPCQHPRRNKIKRLHEEVKDGVISLVTTEDCVKCGHVHILDVVTKGGGCRNCYLSMNFGGKGLPCDECIKEYTELGQGK